MIVSIFVFSIPLYEEKKMYVVSARYSSVSGSPEFSCEIANYP